MGACKRLCGDPAANGDWAVVWVAVVTLWCVFCAVAEVVSTCQRYQLFPPGLQLPGQTAGLLAGCRGLPNSAPGACHEDLCEHMGHLGKIYAEVEALWPGTASARLGLCSICCQTVGLETWQRQRLPAAFCVTGTDFSMSLKARLNLSKVMDHPELSPASMTAVQRAPVQDKVST